MPGMLWLETQFVASTCLRVWISEGRKKKIGVTASGKKAKPGHTIAADTSPYPFGTKMNIPGYGWGVVEDRGGAIKGGAKLIYSFGPTSRLCFEVGAKDAAG